MRQPHSVARRCGLSNPGITVGVCGEDIMKSFARALCFWDMLQGNRPAVGPLAAVHIRASANRPFDPIAATTP